MIIPLNLKGDSNSSSFPLHTSLARLGSDDLVLIELQGSLESEGDRGGQSVGELDLSNPVTWFRPEKFHWIAYAIYWSDRTSQLLQLGITCWRGS
jgi:hypothetical protein